MTRALNHVIAIGFLSACLAVPSAQGGLLINGGFEDDGGSFLGWTVINEPGSSGDWYIQMGTAAPPGGSFVVPSPPGPTHAAMTNQNAPGSHLLLQDFVVPVGVLNATLSFERFIGNRFGGGFITPDRLSRLGGPNQQARVDIILPSADPFSVAPADVVQNIFQTQVGDPRISGYTTDVTDLTSLFQSRGGETLTLRFAEVDNQSFFQLGVDEVSLVADVVPEPGSFVIWGLGLAGFAIPMSRRRRRTRSVA